MCNLKQLNCWMNVLYTECLQILISSRFEYVPWVRRNQNHHRTMGAFLFVLRLSVCEIYKKIITFQRDLLNFIELGLNVVLIKAYHHKNFQVEAFLHFKMADI
jgi:hypothetical protein